MPELRDLPINQADLSPLLGSLGADLGVFYRALMEQVEATVDQAKREGWDSERFITAIGALLDPEETSEVEKSLNDTIRTKRIGAVCGLAVWFVNGHYIRDNIYIDFTEGGNHERYEWIPDGEIWIDEEVKPEEVTATIFHEFAEQKVMREKGWDYEHAHDFASGLEIAMRQDDELKTRFEKLIRLQPVLKSAVDLKIQKALVQIRSAIPDEVFKAGLPVGTVRDRKDGKYKKINEGEWERVIEPGEAKIQEQPKETQEQKQPEMKKIKLKGNVEITEKDINDILTVNKKGINKIYDLVKNTPARLAKVEHDKKIKQIDDEVSQMEKEYGLPETKPYRQLDTMIYSDLFNNEYAFKIKNEEQYNDFKNIINTWENVWDDGWTMEKSEKAKKIAQEMTEKYKGTELEKIFEIGTSHTDVYNLTNKLDYNNFKRFCTLQKNNYALHLEGVEINKNYDKVKTYLSDMIGNWTPEEASTKIKEELKESKKGGHWGSADENNSTAKAICIVSDGGKYRPIDKLKDENYIPEFDISEIIEGKKLRNYAQKKIKKFSQEQYPYVYRGMALPEKEIQQLLNNKELPLTGCTAFTFYDKVATHYSESDWTKDLSQKGSIPLLIKLKRNDKFDNSIGMWHEKYDDETETYGSGDNPAFEILTGSTKFKIVSLKKNSEGTYEMEAEVE